MSLDLRALTALGLDARPVLAHMGLTEAELSRMPPRVPFELTERFWCAVRAVYPDRNLSTRIPELRRPEDLDLLGYLCRSCSNLREALGYFNRFHALLLGGHNQLSLSEHDGVAELTIEPPLSTEPMSIEAYLASVGFVARHLTGQPLRPIEVRLAHKRPRDAFAMEQHWGTTLVFEAERDQIVLPQSYLDLPLRQHDPRLLAILERQAKELAAELQNGDDSFAQVVRQAIGRELPRGNSDAASIARVLGVSVRTLARRLEDTGTSFRAVHDEVRHDLARRYLRVPELDVSEIAFMLGFADASSFNRAFRRWSGTSAMRFRANERANDTKSPEGIAATNDTKPSKHR